MKLNAPKKIVWIIAVIFGVLGILGRIFVIPALTINSFWLVAIGFILLAAATFLKGL